MNTQQMAQPCHCGECVQAGVSERESVVNTKTGEQLHGYPLRRWLDARDKFLETARAVAAPSQEKTK